MADYENWSEKHVAVASLFLDPQNPRIPPSSSPLDQRALIAELVEHDNVLDLAKDIAENGYAPIESLVGIFHDDGKSYVLEGNRRLAALKLLLSPESAPAEALKRVRALASKADQESIRKVRVLYAPSREAAAPLIMQKHTRQQIEKWSPLMQARFYRTLADNGLSAVALAKQYGSTPGEVAEFLRTHATYELACRMDLPDEIKAVVHNPRNFPVSTLQRLLDAPKARETLGIDFGGDGAITGKVHQDEFKKAFTRILSDIAKDRLTTRTINTKGDVDTYLASIRESLPNKKRKGRFTAEDFGDKRSAAIEGAVARTSRKTASRPRQSQSLIPLGVRCSVKNARIMELFEELKKMSLEKYPNASAVLFRILLELCVGHYLDKTKKIEPLLEAAKKKNKPNDWYPTLGQLLAEVLKDSSIVVPTLARKKLNRLVSDKNSSLSVDGLDSYVHNRFSPPTSRELRSYWDTFEALFAVVLEEPQIPTRRPAGAPTA